MKSKLSIIFIISVFLGTTVYPQTDTTVTTLYGLEDSEEITHLIYKTKYRSLRTENDTSRFDYYLFNTNTLSNELLFNDYTITSSISPPPLDIKSEHITSFGFFDNDPNKFIYAASGVMGDAYSYISRYDSEQTFSGTEEIFAIKISSENDQNISAVYGGSIILSNDGGLTWSAPDDTQTVQLEFNFLAFSPFEENVVYGFNNNHHLVKSFDYGKTFVTVSDISDWNDKTKLYFDADGTHIYAINEFSFMRSDDNGNPYSWKFIDYVEDPVHFEIDKNIAGEIYLTKGLELFKSTDYGDSFEKIADLENAATGIYKKTGTDTLYLSFTNRIEKFVMKESQTILRKSIKNALRLYPLQVGNFWKFHKDGISYDPYPNPFEYDWYQEVVGDTLINDTTYYKVEGSPLYTNLQRVDSSSGKVYGKDDPKSGERFLFDLLAVEEDRYEVFFGILNGVSISDTLLWDKKREVKKYFYSSLFIMEQSFAQDIGLVWQLEEFDFGYAVNDLLGCVIDGEVFGDTTVVGIEEEILPEELSLTQNYPNPFNPTTTIEYTIPNVIAGGAKQSQQMNVTLKVYDIIGRETAVLVDEIQSPGNYKISFNAEGLSSGVYLYRLTFGSNSITKKMILLR